MDRYKFNTSKNKLAVMGDNNFNDDNDPKDLSTYLDNKDNI